MGKRVEAVRRWRAKWWPRVGAFCTLLLLMLVTLAGHGGGVRDAVAAVLVYPKDLVTIELLTDGTHREVNEEGTDPSATFINTANGYAELCPVDDYDNDGVVSSGDVCTYRYRLEFKAGAARTVTVTFNDAAGALDTGSIVFSGATNDLVPQRRSGNTVTYIVARGLSASIDGSFTIRAKDTAGVVVEGNELESVLTSTLSGQSESGYEQRSIAAPVTVVSAPLADLTVRGGTQYDTSNGYTQNSTYGHYYIEPRTLQFSGWSDHGATAESAWACDVDVSDYPAATQWYLGDAKLEVDEDGVIRDLTGTGAVTLKYKLADEDKPSEKGYTKTYSVRILPHEDSFKAGDMANVPDPGTGEDRNFDTSAYTVGGSTVSASRGRNWPNNNWASNSWSYYEPPVGNAPAIWGYDIYAPNGSGTIYEPGKVKWSRTGNWWNQGTTDVERPAWRRITADNDLHSKLYMNVDQLEDADCTEVVTAITWDTEDDATHEKFVGREFDQSRPVVVTVGGKKIDPGLYTCEWRSVPFGNKGEMWDGVEGATAWVESLYAPDSEVNQLRVTFKEGAFTCGEGAKQVVVYAPVHALDSYDPVEDNYKDLSTYGSFMLLSHDAAEGVEEASWSRINHEAQLQFPATPSLLCDITYSDQSDALNIDSMATGAIETKWKFSLTYANPIMTNGYGTTVTFDLGVVYDASTFELTGSAANVWEVVSIEGQTVTLRAKGDTLAAVNYTDQATTYSNRVWSFTVDTVRSPASAWGDFLTEAQCTILMDSSVSYMGIGTVPDGTVHADDSDVASIASSNKCGAVLGRAQEWCEVDEAIGFSGTVNAGNLADDQAWSQVVVLPYNGDIALMDEVAESNQQDIEIDPETGYDVNGVYDSIGRTSFEGTYSTRVKVTKAKESLVVEYTTNEVTLSDQSGATWTACSVNEDGEHVVPQGATAIRFSDVGNVSEVQAAGCEYEVWLDADANQEGDVYVLWMGTVVTPAENCPIPWPWDTEVVASTISGKVWHDEDDDSLLEEGEDGYAGVVVELRDSEGNVVERAGHVYTTVTDDNGDYRFTGLHSGDYTVVLPDVERESESTRALASVTGETAEANTLRASVRNRFDVEVPTDQTYSYKNKRNNRSWTDASVALGVHEDVARVDFGFVEHLSDVRLDVQPARVTDNGNGTVQVTWDVLVENTGADKLTGGQLGLRWSDEVLDVSVSEARVGEYELLSSSWGYTYFYDRSGGKVYYSDNGGAMKEVGTVPAGLSVLSQSSVYAYFSGDDGTVWYSSQGSTLKDVTGDAPASLRVLSQNGGSLYLQGEDGTIWFTSGSTLKTYDKALADCRAVLCQDGSYIWIQCDDGTVWYIDSSTMKDLTGDPQVRYDSKLFQWNSILYIKDEDGTVWYSGRGSTLQPYGQKLGYGDSYIYLIDDERVWCSYVYSYTGPVDITGDARAADLTKLSDFGKYLYLQDSNGAVWYSGGSTLESYGQIFSASGNYWYLTDGEKVWYASYVSAPKDVTGDAPIESLTVLFQTDRYIYVQADDGTIWYSDGSPLMACGQELSSFDGYLYLTDGESVWYANASSGSQPAIRDITGEAPTGLRKLSQRNNDLYLQADDGSIWSTSGSTLKSIVSDAPTGLSGLAQYNYSTTVHLYLEDQDGSVYYCNGSKLINITGDAPANLSVISSSIYNSYNYLVYFQAGDGTVWYRNGSTLKNITGNAPSSLTELSQSSGCVYLRADDGTIWYSNNGSMLKSVTGSAPEGLAALSQSSKHLYLRDADGTVWYSEGLALTEVEGDVTTNSLAKVSQSSKHLYLRDADGTVWYSDGSALEPYGQVLSKSGDHCYLTDGEKVWYASYKASPTEITGDAPVGSLGVLSQSSSYLYLQADDGTVWHTENGSELRPYGKLLSSYGDYRYLTDGEEVWYAYYDKSPVEITGEASADSLAVVSQYNSYLYLQAANGTIWHSSGSTLRPYDPLSQDGEYLYLTDGTDICYGYHAAPKAVTGSANAKCRAVFQAGSGLYLQDEMTGELYYSNGNAHFKAVNNSVNIQTFALPYATDVDTGVNTTSLADIQPGDTRRIQVTGTVLKSDVDTLVGFQAFYNSDATPRAGITSYLQSIQNAEVADILADDPDVEIDRSTLTQVIGTGTDGVPSMFTLPSVDDFCAEGIYTYDDEGTSVHSDIGINAVDITSDGYLSATDGPHYANDDVADQTPAHINAAPEDEVVDTTAALGGVAWYDADKDGVLDEDEERAGGITVTVTSEALGITHTVTTDADGKWTVTGLSASDEYQVAYDIVGHEHAGATWTATAARVEATDDGTTSDVDATGYVVDLTPAHEVTDQEPRGNVGRADCGLIALEEEDVSVLLVKGDRLGDEGDHITGELALTDDVEAVETQLKVSGTEVLQGSVETYEPTANLGSGTSGWTLGEDGVYRSNNKGVPSSKAALTFSFDIHGETNSLAFDWYAAGESPSFDYGQYVLSKDGTAVETSAKLAGTLTTVTDSAYRSVTKEDLEPGSYTLTFTYQKDSSVNKYADQGFVKNVSIVDDCSYTTLEGAHTVVGDYGRVQDSDDDPRTQAYAFTVANNGPTALSDLRVTDVTTQGNDALLSGSLVFLDASGTADTGHEYTLVDGVPLRDGEQFTLQPGESLIGALDVPFTVGADSHADTLTVTATGVSSQGTPLKSVSATDTLTTSYEAQEPVHVQLRKVSADDLDGATLANASFTVELTDAADVASAVNGCNVVSTVERVTTGVTGTATIHNLLPGVYKVTETVAPGGFVCPTGSWYFQVVFDTDGSTRILVQASSSDMPYAWGTTTEAGDGILTVSNARAVQLPSTGVSFIGLLGVGVAATAAGLVLKRRKKEEPMN